MTKNHIEIYSKNLTLKLLITTLVLISSCGKKSSINKLGKLDYAEITEYTINGQNAINDDVYCCSGYGGCNSSNNFNTIDPSGRIIWKEESGSGTDFVDGPNCEVEYSASKKLYLTGGYNVVSFKSDNTFEFNWSFCVEYDVEYADSPCKSSIESSWDFIIFDHFDRDYTIQTGTWEFIDKNTLKLTYDYDNKTEKYEVLKLNSNGFFKFKGIIDGKEIIFSNEL